MEVGHKSVRTESCEIGSQASVRVLSCEPGCTGEAGGAALGPNFGHFRSKVISITYKDIADIGVMAHTAETRYTSINHH